MTPYNPGAFEEKWMKEWKKNKLFQGTAASDPQDKFYALFAFAYPSGSGLHVGHVESMTALDILVRYLRMTGKDVFFPVGWDAFGLPAENYAIKTGIHPAKTTMDAIHAFERQVARLGISYDWESEVATCDPTYYTWTQWIFIQLFKAGLAYRDKGWVNWCPQDKTVLANEQVVDGACERCGAAVVQKELEQWKFKITAYQDELLDGLNQVDWPAATKQQQINWIGKSEGAEVIWKVQEQPEMILRTFTTRLDTIYGVTFVVISPEKFLEYGLMELVPEKQRGTVGAYVDQAMHKTEENRRVGEKEKTGVNTHLHLVHPLTGEPIDLWVADYVLAGYGTGIVQGVPSHDTRDHAFATKFNIPEIEVVKNMSGEDVERFVGYGELMNSEIYTGLESKEAIKQMIADHPEAFAKKTSYKLRDWLISRQRYWGAPIPMVYCADCANKGKGEQASMPGWYAVDEKELPILLPDLEDFKPTDDGKSPIEKASDSWKYTTCPGCQGKAKREVDTMDTFVDSSWYFLRYVDAKNTKVFASKNRLKHWLPADMYLIGPEHIVLHLLYARFFTKFLRDQGYFKFDEPFLKMRHQGMILGPDGKKMSKSKGNVISPDEIIEKFGADTLRMYEMFMGPLDADKAWDMSSVAGIYRFLSRVNSLVEKNQALKNPGESLELKRKLHKTIKKVGDDIANLKFNTAIAALMELMNLWSVSLEANQGLSSDELMTVIRLIAPFAPYMAEEVAHTLEPKMKGSIHEASWPAFDASLIVSEDVEIVVQLNAKVKGRVTVALEHAKDSAFLEAKARELLESQNLLPVTTTKAIVVPGKLVNIVGK